MTASASTTSPATRIEELGRIILAYSEVTERLQQSQSRLERTVESLRGELSEKNRQLERKNRLAALGEMAAGMAHEIRNPLGGIQLYASMLAQDIADRPAALEVVGKISTGVRRLETLVSHVLQFTREIPAHRVMCDLTEIVSQTVELATPHFEKSRGRLRVTTPSSLKIFADPLLLGQALLNLLLNAAEALPAEGEAELTCRRLAPPSQAAPEAEETPCGFIIAVSDTGPGLAPEAIEKIFNPFFTTKDNGTGLGLAIVHRIVEAHDGTIAAFNRPGGGATFEIRIEGACPRPDADGGPSRSIIETPSTGATHAAHSYC